MALYPRTTFFYKDLENKGWSETFYGANVTDLPTLKLQAENLAFIRTRMIARGVKLTYIRNSFDDVFGDSLLGTVPPGGGASSYNKDIIEGEESDADFAYSVLLLRMQSGSLYRKSQYLSAVPDSSQSPGKNPDQMGAAWKKTFAAYKDELCSGRWGVKVLAKTNDIAPVKVVTGFAIAGPLGVVTASAHGFAGGDSVRISGVKGGSPSINGVWTVRSVVSADSFSILGWDVNNTFNLIGNGTVRKRTYTIVPITDVLIRKYTERKRGRPFDQSRGRARNKKKA